jgi:hypothetical protein
MNRRELRFWLCVALGMQISTIICYLSGILLWATLTVTLIASGMAYMESMKGE